MSDLYMLWMLEGSSLNDHIDEFSSIIMELENLGVKIDDEDKALL